INCVQGDATSTPFQRDEPQALIPPGGAYIDFYLKAAARGAVTLEILDAAGKVMRKWPGESDQQAGRGTRGLARVSPLWQAAPEVFSTAAGVHRVGWRPGAPAEPRPAGAGG